MARRGESIFKRKDGRWEARVIEYRGDGQRFYRSLYGKTYGEVKGKKERYIAFSHSIALGEAKKSPIFSEQAEHWLASVKSSVKESTYTRYYRTVHSYLLPLLGKYAVGRIDITIVNRLKEALLIGGGKRKNGLSEKTVTDILSVLKLIINHAAAEGFEVINTSLIRDPKQKKKNMQIIPQEQSKRLEEILLASNDPLSLGILLALHTGIRNGELCGLKWGDVCFLTGTLHIRHIVERISDLDPLHKAKTKLIIGEPKTASSRREIPLPTALCAYLKQRCGNADEYILTGTSKPSEPHTLYVHYSRFLRRNGFDSYTFHALRHTFATRGIESGFDTKSLSEILGHSDVTTTLKCYVHPSLEQKRRQMEALFDGKIRGQKYGN